MIIAPNANNILKVILHTKFLMSACLTYHPLILAVFNGAFVRIMFIILVLAHLTCTLDAGACRHDQDLN